MYQSKLIIILWLKAALVIAAYPVIHDSFFTVSCIKNKTTPQSIPTEPQCERTGQSTSTVPPGLLDILMAERDLRLLERNIGKRGKTSLSHGKQLKHMLRDKKCHKLDCTKEDVVKFCSSKASGLSMEVGFAMLWSTKDTGNIFAFANTGIPGTPFKFYPNIERKGGASAYDYFFGTPSGTPVTIVSVS